MNQILKNLLITIDLINIKLINLYCACWLTAGDAFWTSFGATRISRMDMDQTIHPGWAGGFLSFASIGQFLNLKWPGYSWTKIVPVILSSLFHLYTYYCLVFPKLFSRLLTLIAQYCFYYLATPETTTGSMLRLKISQTNQYICCV